MSGPQANPTEEKYPAAAHALGLESAGVVPAYARPNGELEWPSTGLTKREYFAGLAMQAFLSVPAWHSSSRELTASEAVMQADALLKELARG